MLIKVKVKTDCKQEVIKATSADQYNLSLKESATNNMANDRVMEIFHKLFSKSKIRIIKGHHSPNKIIDVEKVLTDLAPQ